MDRPPDDPVPPADPALEARFKALHGWSGRAPAQPPESALAEAGRLGRRGPCVATSACLVGIRCRYDGGHKHHPELTALLGKAGVEVLPLCPEVLAGFGVPRPPMTLQGGDGAALMAGRADLVIEADPRHSRAERLRAGARSAAALVDRAGCVLAVLKDRSPSCAVHHVHTTEGLTTGVGAFTALLADRQVRCLSEEEVGQVAPALRRDHG